MCEKHWLTSTQSLVATIISRTGIDILKIQKYNPYAVSMKLLLLR